MLSRLLWFSLVRLGASSTSRYSSGMGTFHSRQGPGADRDKYGQYYGLSDVHGHGKEAGDQQGSFYEMERAQRMGMADYDKEEIEDDVEEADPWSSTMATLEWVFCPRCGMFRDEVCVDEHKRFVLKCSMCKMVCQYNTSKAYFVSRISYNFTHNPPTPHPGWDGKMEPCLFPKPKETEEYMRKRSEHQDRIPHEFFQQTDNIGLETWHPYPHAFYALRPQNSHAFVVALACIFALVGLKKFRWVCKPVLELHEPLIH